MNKVFVLVFLAGIGACAIVWYLDQAAKGSPGPEPTPYWSAKLDVSPETMARFNDFSFLYAGDISREAGERNTVFSPLTTFSQILFLTRCVSHRLGSEDSAAALSAKALDALLVDPAVEFTSDFTVSKDLGIDSWVRGEFKRNKITYEVDPGEIASRPGKFAAGAAARPEMIRGLWNSRFRMNCTWKSNDSVSLSDYVFINARGTAITWQFVGFFCAAGYGLLPEGKITIAEIPYREGCSFLVAMPQQWDPAIALAALKSVVSGETQLARTESVEVKFPKFSFECQENIDGLLARIGYFDKIIGGIPLVGTGTRDALCEATVDTDAKITCDQRGTRIEAKTTTEFTMSLAVCDPLPEPIVINRPFLYAIRHDATGIIVGMGWVVDPVFDKKR